MDTRSSASNPGGEPERRGHRFALRVLPPLAAMVIFARAVGFGFVLDDDLVISERSRFLSAPFSPSAALRMVGYENVGLPFYRPAYLALLWFGNWMGGGSAWAFHALNVALHALNVALVALLARRLGASSPLAALVAFFFGAHPGVVLGVAHAAACADPFSTTWILVGLLAWGSFRDGGRPLSLALFGVASLLALLTKEIAFALPLLVLAHGVLAPRGTPGTSFRRTGLAALGAFAIAVVLYFLCRRLAMTDKPPLGLNPAGPAAVLRTLGHYARSFAWPFGIVVRPNRAHFTHGAGLLVLGALTVAAVIVLVIRSRDPLLRFGLAWVAVTLAPVAQVIHVDYPGSHHYLYLPAVGVAMVLGAGARRLRSLVPEHGPRIAVSIAGAVVACALGGESSRALGAFSDAEALSIANLASDPRNEVALELLADLEGRRGRADVALSLANRAVAAEPNSAGAAYAVALALERLGEHARAVAAYDALLSRCEGSLCLECLANGGIQAFQLGDQEGALRRLSAARDRAPTWGRGWALLVAFHNDAGDPSTALAVYDAAKRVAAPSADLETYHGVTLQLLGRPEDALGAFDRAVVLDARAHRAFKARGLLHWNTSHDAARALPDLKRYLVLAPPDPSRSTIEHLVATLEGRAPRP